MVGGHVSDWLSDCWGVALAVVEACCALEGSDLTFRGHGSEPGDFGDVEGGECCMVAEELGGVLWRVG